MNNSNQDVDSPKSSRQSETKRTNHNRDHVIKKRPAQKPELAENILYVSTSSNNKALLDKCSKLIMANHDEIIVYCMGAAIQRGILLALQVCEKHLSYKLSTNTYTTDLIDDMEPATDDADYEIQQRKNSALKIRIFKTDLLKTDVR